MDKNLYLKTPVVEGFCDFLVDVIDGNIPLEHSYAVESKVWKKHLGDKIKSDGILSLSTFKDAYEEYFWSVDDEDQVETGSSTNGDLPANQKFLDRLALQIKTAVNFDNQSSAFLAATKILDWGQVYRGSLSWLIKKYEQGKLVESLRRGTAIMDGHSYDGLIGFDHVDLRMDSGTTKIFSLLSEHSIIYDDRVGAALGLLAVDYLLTLPLAVRPVKTPAELQFLRSSLAKRNPSRLGYKFPTRGKTPSEVHSRSNLQANWILGSILPRLKSAWSLRDLEAALFMIGYRSK